MFGSMIFPSVGFCLLCAINFQVTVGALLTGNNLPIFSWNTLSVDDTFASGWGAMAEIVRMNNLIASNNISTSEAQGILLAERYQRITGVLNRARLNNKIIAIQEADLESVAGGEYLLKYFIPEIGSWKTACKSMSDAEQELLIIDTKYVEVVSTTVFNEDGVLGCSATVRLVESAEVEVEVTVLTAHLSASMIRSPATTNSTLEVLLSLMPPTGVVVVGGDFNAHLPDLLQLVRELDQGKHFWSLYSAENRTVTTSKTSNPEHLYQYTVQHEYNFIAAYDGFLTRDYYHHEDINSSDPSSKASAPVVVHDNGFMPKYLGDSPHNVSSFRYSEGMYPVIDGELLFYGKAYPRDTNEANVSLSDHLAVSVVLSFN